MSGGAGRGARVRLLPASLVFAALPLTSMASDPRPDPYATDADRAQSAVFAAREADWRNGAVVYQVLVDRFAPPRDLQAKRELYPPPKVLRRWDEVPTRGVYLPEANVWSHEIDFWGGDLQGLRSRLDWVQGLGADVLYLNPIHLAWTNHKYDALDYKAMSPEFGAEADFDALVADVHGRGMKLVLDGVFNHMGRNAPMFVEAASGPGSRYRDWFVWGTEHPGGARIWMDARNLPELNLENPDVRDYVYGARDSVVQSYLARGVDGWRLDVGYDIGFRFLGELTAAAHARKPGSLVVGEIANYPQEWFPHVDGVMGFSLRELILRTVRGELAPRAGARMIERLIADAGTGNMLKSWLQLDNHDTHRIATELPDVRQRRLAQAWQFTLPGSPTLYYGSELGMTGGGDPEMRAPMRWDLANEDNATLAWTRKLIGLRRAHRALRIGDVRWLETTRLVGFERHTDRIGDAVLVLANPSDDAVAEWVLVPDSKLMNMSRLLNLLDPASPPLPVVSALVRVELPPHGVLLLAPDIAPKAGYSPYKRVH